MEAPARQCKAPDGSAEGSFRVASRSRLHVGNRADGRKRIDCGGLRNSSSSDSAQAIRAAGAGGRDAECCPEKRALDSCYFAPGGNWMSL